MKRFIFDIMLLVLFTTIGVTVLASQVSSQERLGKRVIHRPSPICMPENDGIVQKPIVYQERSISPFERAETLFGRTFPAQQKEWYADYAWRGLIEFERERERLKLAMLNPPRRSTKKSVFKQHSFCCALFFYCCWRPDVGQVEIQTRYVSMERTE